MTIEKILRSESTRSKSSNYIIHMTSDEGKKFINQDYLDSTDDVEPVVCSQVYLAENASELDWSEIDEQEATSIMETWEKKQEELIESEMKSHEDLND